MRFMRPCLQPNQMQGLRAITFHINQYISRPVRLQLYVCGEFIMKSFEALELAVGKKAAEFAKRLRLSTSLIHKWTEPSTDYTDSGALNPLDRVEYIIETSLSLGNSRADALAPMQYLSERFSLILLDMPISAASNVEIQMKLLQTIEEFGDLAQVSSKALMDGKITRREVVEIEKEGWELIRQAAAFMQAVREAAR